jgi:hypothetical protein
MIKFNSKCIHIIWLSILLSGCVSTPVIEIEPFDTSVSFEGDFDRSWSKLVAFLSTNDVSIGTIEKDSGLITLSGDNLSVSLLREYCDATAPFLWSLQSGGAKGSVLMTADDGFVTATVNIKLTATSMTTDYSTGRVTYSTKPCNSRGVFETAVLNSIE